MKKKIPLVLGLHDAAAKSGRYRAKKFLLVFLDDRLVHTSEDVLADINNSHTRAFIYRVTEKPHEHISVDHKHITSRLWLKKISGMEEVQVYPTYGYLLYPRLYLEICSTFEKIRRGVRTLRLLLVTALHHLETATHEGISYGPRIKFTISKKIDIMCKNRGDVWTCWGGRNKCIHYCLKYYCNNSEKSHFRKKNDSELGSLLRTRQMTITYHVEK